MQPNIIDLLTALIDNQGCVVSSASCSEAEIVIARADNRFYVDADGFGFVLRTKAWRRGAEAALKEQLQHGPPIAGCLVTN